LGRKISTLVPILATRGAFFGKFLSFFFSAKGGLGRKILNFSTDFGHKRAFFGGKLKIFGRHRGINVDLKLDFAEKLSKIGLFLELF